MLECFATVSNLHPYCNFKNVKGGTVKSYSSQCKSCRIYSFESSNKKSFKRESDSCKNVCVIAAAVKLVILTSTTVNVKAVKVMAEAVNLHL